VTSVCESCADWWEKVKEKKGKKGDKEVGFFLEEPVANHYPYSLRGNVSTVQCCSG
jgi:hypothetical protein